MLHLEIGNQFDAITIINTKESDLHLIAEKNWRIIVNFKALKDTLVEMLKPVSEELRDLVSVIDNIDLGGETLSPNNLTNVNSETEVNQTPLPWPIDFKFPKEHLSAESIHLLSNVNLKADNKQITDIIRVLFNEISKLKM